MAEAEEVGGEEGNEQGWIRMRMCSEEEEYDEIAGDCRNSAVQSQNRRRSQAPQYMF